MKEMNNFGSTLYVYRSPSFVRIVKFTMVQWAVLEVRVEERKDFTILVSRASENQSLQTKKEMGSIYT
jgi:hypothetical protein